MSIGPFCNRDTATVYREASIPEAAKIMRQWHVGCLVVVENSERGVKPVGIVTDHDLVIEILATELEPGAVTVGDIMSINLLLVREEDGLWETLHRMKSKGVRRVPVTDADGCLAGLITLDDLLDRLLSEFSDLLKICDLEQHRDSGRP